MRKTTKILAGIMSAAILFSMLTAPAVIAASTEPTITTGTNMNNSRVRTRSEFIEWHSSANLPNLIHFRNTLYTTAEFFDSHHGLVFRYGVINTRNSRRVRALNVTLRTGATSPPRAVQAVQQVAPPKQVQYYETYEAEIAAVVIPTPPDDIGFDRIALEVAGFEREQIQEMFEWEVIRIVNEIRAEHDLPPLVHHPALANIARLRTEEMVKYNVFSHKSPTTGLEHTAHARAMGLNLRYAGENAVSGRRTPQVVVDAWMASSAHRDFILSGHSTSRFRALRYMASVLHLTIG